ncbi:unnamed protein product [Blepharisma stoltei]|uniref:Uncharacterized protein n=1 Tax=Blepharisma stoltei TaxID=1481888 RepID=A0AAU9IBL8_9CILI|nr:unnamed protein product [Blepharisma stoltei]
MKLFLLHKKRHKGSKISFLTYFNCNFLHILLIRHRDDVPVGNSRRLTLEECLTFYPVTRRALDRAVEEIFNEPKPYIN